MYYMLYNPTSNIKKYEKKISRIYRKIRKKGECYKINLLEINKKEKAFIESCKPEDVLVLCGGDGTLDQFLNRIKGEEFSCKLYFFSCGSGNDFVRDYKTRFIDVSHMIHEFPKLRINRKEEYLFVNGVGMGIDAVVCRSKAQYKFSEVNKSYFSIGLSCLKTFRPFQLDVEIDNEKRHYDKVWFFICNQGKYMGGGMKVTPRAVRNDEYLDVCIVHSLSLRKIIMIFPLIFLGKHTLFKKYVDVFRCKKFKAIPDGCNLLQRDGEIMDYVTEVEVER